MMRLLSAAALLMCLASTPAAAQLRLAILTGTTETPVGASVDLGSTAVGDALNSRFRLRNIGVAAVSLTTLRIAGAGFQITGAPTPPILVAPGSNVDFTVRFLPTASGSFSASLTANSITLIVRASAAPVPVLSFLQGGQKIILSSGETIDFGRVERTAPAIRRFTLENSATVPLTVNQITVTGRAFRGPVGIALPLRLEPGTSVGFDLVFEPSDTEVQQGMLTVDQRTFRLIGMGIDPPQPRPIISLNSDTLTSAQQGRVSIRFENAPRTATAGRLRIEFRSSLTPPVDDRAIQFVEAASREIAFSSTPGVLLVSFGTATEAVFQTGSIAGTIVFIAQFAGFTEQASVTVAPAVAGVSSARATRTANSLEVVVTGFDNTRSLGQISYTFFDRASQPLQAAVRVDTAAAFQSFFASSDLGGLFSLRAVFPVTGNINEISAAELEIVNSAGTARSARIPF